MKNLVFGMVVAVFSLMGCAGTPNAVGFTDETMIPFYEALCACGTSEFEGSCSELERPEYTESVASCRAAVYANPIHEDYLTYKILLVDYTVECISNQTEEWCEMTDGLDCVDEAQEYATGIVFAGDNIARRNAGYDLEIFLDECN